MHPILAHRGRLALYIAVWIAFGGLLAAIISATGQMSGGTALLFAEPLALLLGFQSVFCWYLVRVLPPHGTRQWRLITTWLGVTLVDIAIWVALGYAWAEFLRSAGYPFAGEHRASELIPLLFFSGTVAFAVCVLEH